MRQSNYRQKSQHHQNKRTNIRNGALSLTMMNRLHHVWVQLACCFTITAVVAAAAAAWTATITNAYHISYIPNVRTFRAATISIRATKATETLSIIHHNVDDDLPDDGSNNDTDTQRVPVLQSKAPKGKPKTAPTTTTTPTHWIVDSDQVIYQKRSIPQVATTLPSNTTSEPGGIQHHNLTVVAVPTVFHCTIRGNPLPLRRHRTRRGFMYNPSAATQLTFRQLVQRQIMDHVVVRMDNVDDDGTTSNDEMGGITIPLWNIDQPIAVSIVFRMKRPNTHFIGNKPFVERTTTNATKKTKATSSTTANSSRLRPTAPKVMCTTSMRTDIDNLAKFVLDSLNNVTYADDKQIVSLHVMKLFDNDVTNRYQGSTTITIRLLQDDDMTTHIMEQERNFLFLSNATESINTRNNNNNMF